jgi:hypothetical protein
MKGFYKSVAGISVTVGVLVLSALPARAITVDGSLDADYGSAVCIQTINTGFGDSSFIRPTSNGPDANGSELDAAYGLIQGGNLYLFVAGNSEANGNHINIYIDAGQPGGQNILNIPDWSWMGSFMNGSVFSSGFNANLMIDANDYDGTLYLDQYVLSSSGSANSYLGSLALSAGIGSGTLGDITIGLNNTNVGGVNDATGTAADQAAALAVATGWELAIPLSLLGNPTQVKVLVVQNGFNDGYLSNQFLPGLPVGTGNVGGGGPYSGGNSSSFDVSAIPNEYFIVGTETPNCSTLSEDFESYPVASWPSPAWTPDANAVNDPQNNQIVSSPGGRTGKGLQLFGAIGGCWAALGYHQFCPPAAFELEFDVYNGSESLSGCHPERGYVGLRQGTYWANYNRALVEFLGNGDIRCHGAILGQYETLRWYHVKVQYARSGNQLTLTYWLDGQLLGNVATVIADTSLEETLDHLDLASQEGSVWFDNIRVTKGPETSAPGWLYPRRDRAGLACQPAGSSVLTV